MLTVVTGGPGAAKTLYVISVVDAIHQAEGRPVFYFGIDGVTLDWIELDRAEDWYKCPEGSLIVVDEAWKVFPTRKIGADVPGHVEAMSEHRHVGHDVWVMTQHSTQIDTFIRKMAGSHVHLKNVFGSNVSSRWEWAEIANERDGWERKAAASSTFRYPKKYFNTYKSSSMHTVRRRLPWVRIGVLLGGVALVPLLIWAGARAVWPDDRSIAGGDGAAVRSQRVESGSHSGRSWAGQFKPAVSGLPWTAPFYSEVVKAESYPRVSGCMRLEFSDGRDLCRCNDQQGNRLHLSYGGCLAFLRDGAFDFSGEWSRPSYVRAGPASGAPAGGPASGSDK